MININNFSITQRECTTTYYNGNELIEAEDYCEMNCIQREVLSTENENIGFVNDGDYIRFSNLDFLNESIQSISVYASSARQGRTIEVRTNTFDGELIGSVSVSTTDSWSNYEIFKSTFTKTIQGVNDLFLVFRGDNSYLLNLDYFTFNNESTLSNQNNLESTQNTLVTLSPNPAKDFVCLLSDNEQTDFKKVEVYDVNGSKIFSTDIFKLDNKYKIDIQDLTSGMYFILVYDINNLSFHTRLIVKK